jgi:hypothetical protein
MKGGTCMTAEDTHSVNRRDFLKKAGTFSLATGSVAALGGVTLAQAATETGDEAINRYWQKKQKEHEAEEAEVRKQYKAFGPPQKFIYRGTDWSDDKATFYAPLQEDCPYLPEFQSIFTEGTAGQYFKFTLKFGMKDIIRFHGHSCEALYYTAAILRLIADKMFPDGVVDRTLLRGIAGISP